MRGICMRGISCRPDLTSGLTCQNDPATGALSVEPEMRLENKESIQMRSWKIVAAAIAVSACPISMPPAAAAPMMAAGAARLTAGATLPLETVQYRRWHGYRHHGWHHRRHYGPGAAVLGGLAAGAIIGGAIANSRAQANDAVAYCAQRYRSYDVASGSYLGYDGNRHPCP
jgi:hypothetical protein